MPPPPDPDHTCIQTQEIGRLGRGLSDLQKETNDQRVEFCTAITKIEQHVFFIRDAIEEIKVADKTTAAAIQTLTTKQITCILKEDCKDCQEKKIDPIIKTIERHKTFFIIIGASVTIIVILIAAVLPKLF